VTCTYVLVLLALAPAQADAPTGVYRDGFETPVTAWVQDTSDCAVHVRAHTRTDTRVHSGRRSESISLATTRGTQVLFRYPRLPRIAITKDGYVSLWLKASRSGPQLLLRAVLPHEPPGPPQESSRIVIIPGPTYERAGKWQELRIDDLATALERQLRLVRAQLGRDVKSEDAYVDQVILNVYSGAGVYDVYIDDLSAYPIAADDLAAPEVQIDSPPDSQGPSIRIAGESLQVDGVPRLPIVLRLKRHERRPLPVGVDGYVVAAAAGSETPPSESGWLLRVLPIPQLGALPVAEAEVQAMAARLAAAGPIAGWIVDARHRMLLPTAKAAEQRRELLERARVAVGALHRLDDSRPVFVVADSMYSRLTHLCDGLVLGENPLGTTLELADHCDATALAHALARPGTFLWATVPCGYAGKLSASATYEQLRLLAFGALIAGARGLIFDLGYDAAADDRTIRRVLLCVRELRLYEPFVAAAGPPEPLRLDRVLVQGAGEREFEAERKRLQSVLSTGRPQARPVPEVADEFRGAIYRLPRAALVLIAWMGPQAQMVPGQLAANRVTFVVEGVPETAIAWQITPAGIIPLQRRRVAGGLEVTIREFDTAAAVVLSTDRRLLDDSRRLVRQHAAEAASFLEELAAERLARLERYAAQFPVPPETTALLARAQVPLARATSSPGLSPLIRYRAAAEALRVCRLAERGIWEVARRGYDPAASPYLGHLELLPKHGELVRLVSLNDARRENLLPEGNFEDPDALVRSGWSQALDLPDGLTGGVLVTTGGGFNRSRGLELQVEPVQAPEGVSTAVFDGETGVTLYSRPLETPEDGVYVVRLRVRIAQPLRPDSAACLVYDTVWGVPFAYRLATVSSGWRSVVLLRPVRRGQTFRVAVTLRGAGAARIDDLDVRFIPYRGIVEARASIPEAEAARPPVSR